MQFRPKNVKKFQEGGQMAPEEQVAPEEVPMEEAPAEGDQDPLMMLAQGASQALQAQDCQIAMQVCQGLLQLLQQMSGAQEAQQGEPVFKKGGKLLRRIKK